MRVLTGITTTGEVHLGNYLGAIKPSIDSTKSDENVESFFFLADYHALTKASDPIVLQESVLNVAASWLACGLDPSKTVFYRQSQVPQILQMYWILANYTAKGALNRAHSYKAIVDQNTQTDPDKGVFAGLYMYPVLMSADILSFDVNLIPVGKDQLQHIEICRDIALKFNHMHGDVLVVPEAKVNKELLLTGTDGRKMSKSYKNTIPLFADEDKLWKIIRKIKTDSVAPELPKSKDANCLFELFSSIADAKDTEQLANRYADGIGWGDVKKLLHEQMVARFTKEKQEYEHWLTNKDLLLQKLKLGAEQASDYAGSTLSRVQTSLGLEFKSS